ncbi:MAG: phosphoribosylanthranilate isomerase [Terriglobia bacterium]
MVRVKVCGITNRGDALAAIEAGADALGFNFYLGSPRYIEPEEAERIVAELPPFVTPVGVFVNESRQVMKSLAARCDLRTVQLHGDELPAAVAALAPLAVIKAFAVGRRWRPQLLKNYKDCAAFLLDTGVKGKRGGTGKRFDWQQARRAKAYGRLILAGGLTPENIEDAIAAVKPYGVDVCTGVERHPGKKDLRRLRNFIQRARAAAAAL